MGSQLDGRRIPVTHLVLSLETGGLETVVLNLVRHGDRDRFSHRVICLRGPGVLAPLVEAAGAPVIALQGAGRMSSVRALLPHLARARGAVLHTHNPQPHQFGAIAKLLGRARVLVHTKHGRNYPDDPVAVWVNRQCARVSDMIVPVSADAADVARRIERVDSRKIRVILNGIETHGYGGTPLAEDREPRAICVARLDPVKDIPGLLEAVSLVRRSIPGFRLDLVGEGPDRQRIEETRRRLGLGDAVALLGHRTDIPSQLGRANLFLLASVSEGISLTLLEAMAAGLPIVATSVGGTPEIVLDGETGYLVPARDPRALADAAVRLLSTPGLSARMSAAARKRAHEAFDVRIMTARYEELYLELLARRGIAP